MAVRVPEPTERAAEAKRRLVILGREGRLDRGAQVVVLHFEASEPEELVIAPQAGISFLREARELGRVTAKKLVFFAALGELLACEVADGFEHREPRLARDIFGVAEKA